MKLVMERGVLRLEGELWNLSKGGRRPSAASIFDGFLLWALDTNAIDGVAAHFGVPPEFVLARAKLVRMRPAKTRRSVERMAELLKEVGVSAVGGRLECNLDAYVEARAGSYELPRTSAY